MKLVLALGLILLSGALLTEAIWKQPIAAFQAPGWAAKRGDSFKRYVIDPVGPADTIYATVIVIGGRTYRVIMDTGSSTTFLMGLNCTLPGGSGCKYATNIFPYQGASSMFDYTSNQCGSGNQITYDGKTNACHLSALYADGSNVQAVGVTTTSTFGPYGGNCKIGMGYGASASFLLAGTDGIWGMTRPNNRYVGVTGPLHAAINSGMPATFAICLKDVGGELHLGGYESSYSTAPISWLNYDTMEAHYVIALSSVSVGSTAVAGANGLPVILDSGSTLGYISQTLHTNIISQINTQCPSSCPTSIFYSSTFTPALTDPADWPSITLTFATGTGGTAAFTLTPAQYLLDQGGGRYLGGFIESSGGTLLGGAFLRNWYTIFDISTDRIGLGPINLAQCTGNLGPAVPLSTMTPSTTIPPNTPFTFFSTPGTTILPTPPPSSPGSPTSSPTSGTPVTPALSSPTNDAQASQAFNFFTLILSIALCVFSLL